MKDSLKLGIIVSFGIIVFGIIYVITNGFFSASTTVDVGSMTIEFPSTVDVEQPLSASITITDGNYDSFDSPLGTSFETESTGLFLIGGLGTTSSTANIRIDYGYGDTHVENSASPPTNSVVVGSVVIPLNAGLERVPVFADIPASKHPFVRVSGANSNGHVTIIGVPSD